MAGRPAEGLEAIDGAIELMAGRVNVLYPELPIVKGDLLVAAPDRGDAEEWYRHGLDVARAAGARMTQLGAATRLARLRRDSGESWEEERGALRTVYGTFT